MALAIFATSEIRHVITGLELTSGDRRALFAWFKSEPKGE